MSQSHFTAAYLSDFNEEASPVRVWIRDFSDAEVMRLERAVELVGVEKQPVLPVFINSLGGNVNSLFAMIDLFHVCPVEVATVALGVAMSAACDLLAAGTPGRRFVAPNTAVMVHDSSDQLRGKNADLQVKARWAQHERDLSFDLFAKHTGKTRTFWNRWLRKRMNVNVYLTAQEAVGLGIADHVGLPLPTGMQTKTKLTDHMRKR